MRFEKTCPVCIGRWQRSLPDWSPDKIRLKPKPSPTKPLIVKQEVIDDEMVITLKYPMCGDIVSIKIPHVFVKTIDGYVMVKTANGYMPEHRFIWEQTHGKLPPNYVIHHINGVKCDNRLENLIAMARHKHNSNMAEHEPMVSQCPYCNKELKVIKISRKSCHIF